MKKFFRLGVSVFVPIAGVIVVFYWFYNLVMDIIIWIIGLFNINLEPRWWFIFPFLLGSYLVIVATGALLSKIKVLKWLKTKFDNLVINSPLVGTVYGFGLEMADTLIDDGKFDGAIKVVEFDWNEWITCIGLLTDAENHIITSATTPNPSNGFEFRVHPKHYSINPNISIAEYGKMVISMGKLMGYKWRREWIKSLKELPFSDLPKDYQ